MRKMLVTVRWPGTRMAPISSTFLDDQGITVPADIAQAVGLPAAEAVRLLTRRQWRDGDVAALRTVADRLRLKVDLEGFGLATGEEGAQ